MFVKILQIAGIVFILLSLPGVYGSPSGATKKVTGVPDVSVDRLNATPDLMQSLPAAALPGEGLSYCGPVAVSNSLVWLSHHGFPKLGMLGGADTPSRQGRLARKLGEHMGSVAGTSPGALMSGIY